MFQISQFNISLAIVWLISLIGAIVLKDTDIFITSVLATLFLTALEAIMFFERIYIETNDNK